MKRKQHISPAKNESEPPTKVLNVKDSNQEKQQITDGEIVVERCNLHLHNELAVYAMAFSSNTKRLCVVRRMERKSVPNGQSSAILTFSFVEFYNAMNPPLVYLEKSIPLLDSLSSVVWIDSCAILGGLSGKLYLLSPFTSKFRRIQICPSEITCMNRLNRYSFVVANNSCEVIHFKKIKKKDEDEEEKDANTFPEFTTNKLAKFSSEKRILSMESSSSKSANQIIALGMVNCISLLTQTVQQMKRRDIEIPNVKSKATLVWSLAFMDNFLFAGDSLGQITIYNPVNGLILKTFKSHLQDVLALTRAGASVFFSGADSRIQVFIESRSDNDRKSFNHSNNVGVIQQCGQRLFHEKSVFSLCELDRKWLLSGGEEGLFISSKHEHCKPLLRPECAFSSTKGILLSRHFTTIDVWHKPMQESSKFGARNSYKLPSLLLRISSDSMGFIKQACISPNGSYLSFSGNVEGTISILHISKNFIRQLTDSAKNRQENEEKRNGLITPFWTNKNQEIKSNEAKERGKTVSAMCSSDDYLFYAVGEYTVFRFEYATKELKLITNKANGGHLTKICTNRSGTLLTALTTDELILIVKVDKSGQAETDIIPVTNQTAYECMFLDEERIVTLMNNHLTCYDLSTKDELFTRTNSDLGLCDTEWMAYLNINEEKQLLCTTNKGRILTISINRDLKNPIVFMSEQSNVPLGRKLDCRIEPFWERKKEELAEEKEYCSRRAILIGHVSEEEMLKRRETF